MREHIGFREYLNKSDLGEEDKKIIIGYLEWRTMTEKTRKNRAVILASIARKLYSLGIGSGLSNLTMKDVKLLHTGIERDYSKNSQQTYISNLKALVIYIDEEHHPIEKIGKLKSIKAGSATPGDKTVLSEQEWIRILNAPGLTMRDRVMLQLLYDGFHRPGEIFLLKWSDFKRDKSGRVNYQITFKTGITRQIAQSVETDKMLQLWRRELGTVPDDSPVFPTRSGKHHISLSPLVRLFKKLNIKGLSPGAMRNTAITHDVERSDHNPSATCFKAWGRASNPMLSTYAAKADSLKLQRQQQDKKGVTEEMGPVMPFGMEDKTMKELSEMQKRMAIMEEAMRRMSPGEK